MGHFDISSALVDDSHTIVMMLTANLNELGYTNIDVYSSAKSALNSIESFDIHYKAIFTDLNMPEMDSRVISLASDLARKNR